MAEPPAAEVLCEGTGPIEAAKLERARIPPGLCNLRGRTLTDHGVGAQVPPPGEGVSVHAASEYGDGQEFTIETIEDGTVVLGSVGPGTPGGTDNGSVIEAQATTSPCQADRSSVSRHQSDVHHWRFNSSTATNGEVGASAALDAIRRGSANLTNTRTDCTAGWGNTKYAATAAYDGTTSLRADMSSGDCTGNDDRNTVDFGGIDGGGTSSYNTLALTCYWFNTLTREVGSADIRFDQYENWAGLTETCTSEWLVDTLATHEWGHVFGMNHIPEDSYSGLLTMSPIMEGMCKRPESTLGVGDWQGIRYGYPN